MSLKSLALGAALAIGVTGVALAQPAAAPQRIERGALVLENVPETPAPVRERLRQYVNTRGASFQDFAPGGGVLVVTRFADAAQVHHVAAPLGMRRQLTFYPDQIGGAAVRPGARAFAFVKDAGGDEFFQRYLYDMDSGKVTHLTEAGLRNTPGVWSRDGRLHVYARAGKDSQDYDIVVVDPADPAARKVLLKGEGAMTPVDWSPDGAQILVSRYVSVTKSRLFLLSVETGALRELTPELNVAYSGGEFTADGAGVIVISDEGSDFARLVQVDLATGARTPLSPADLGWDVEAFDLSPDGRRLAYAVNVGGASELRLMDLRLRSAARALPAPPLPPGVVGNFAWDEAGARLGLTLNSATAPSDVYVYDVRSRALTRWTESEVGGINAATFVAPRLVRFPTFDSAAGGPKEITAWVYAPRTPGPHPAIVNIHGGPESQARPTFSPTIQYWVNELGVAVVVPNVRGSTGYGKAFVELDNGFKREDSVKDIGALLDWMAAQPQAFDMSKVIAYGGSYGGYMVYASMQMFPERFAGGVDIVGISSFVTFLENTSGYRRDLRRAEYGDERDPAMRAHLTKISPLTNAARIKKPLFIVQGFNDPRVPYTEAEQMLAALRRNNVEAWFMMAKDEGHGFAKKANQEAQREAETLFFQKVIGR
ncbi:MAG: prolyl oligopeptidase family serine peptidase [Hyphomonadaceae bacterium]|nr:prolyl oligopeptidase family serine peptidase [Hyphomonadaceae bacterium]